MSGHILRPCGGRHDLGKSGAPRGGAEARRCGAERADDRFVMVSGRAVVVRGGTWQCGARVFARRHGPAAHRGRCWHGTPRSGRSRCPRITSTCSTSARISRGAPRGQGHPHRHRLHRLHDGPCSPTAPRCASCRNTPIARTPTSTCRTPRGPSRPHQHACGIQQESWLPRYGGLISSVDAKGLQLLEGIRSCTRGGPLGGARRVSGNSPDTTSATPAPQATKASTKQAPTPSPEFLGALNPAFAHFADDKVTTPCGTTRRAC